MLVKFIFFTHREASTYRANRLGIMGLLWDGG